MSDQEIKVAGQTTINVVMKDDVAALDEVIVVGYGTAKKQSLTGAVSAVKGGGLHAIFSIYICNSAISSSFYDNTYSW